MTIEQAVNRIKELYSCFEAEGCVTDSTVAKCLCTVLGEEIAKNNVDEHAECVVLNKTTRTILRLSPVGHSERYVCIDEKEDEETYYEDEEHVTLWQLKHR